MEERDAFKHRCKLTGVQRLVKKKRHSSCPVYDHATVIRDEMTYGLDSVAWCVHGAVLCASNAACKDSSDWATISITECRNCKSDVFDSF